MHPRAADPGPSREVLVQLYEELLLAVSQISDIVGVSDQRICELLKEYKIGLREKGAVKDNKNKRTAIGKRNSLDGLFVRSSWEANFALYLRWMKQNGQIRDWKYEPDTFEFLPIKRGTRFYTPDFRVIENDNSVIYYEIKGYFDQKSRTRMRRMSKYYPKITVVVIDHDAYYALAKQMSHLLPDWEIGKR